MTAPISPSSLGGYHISDHELLPLSEFLEHWASDIVSRAERAWESSILLYSQLDEQQREQIRHLALESINIWAIRLRQNPDYARRVFELGQEWGEEAAGWQLHVYSFTKALDILTHVTWEYLAENYSMLGLSPATVFFLGHSRDQVLEDLRVPLLSTYLTKREVEMEQAHFSLQGAISLPGQSLLIELGNRLQANRDHVVPSWTESVSAIPDTTPAMLELLQHRGAALVDLLLSLLQSPTPETGAASLSNVRLIGLESAQAGVSFQEMFHALQQVRPILWDTVYEIYHREQYWYPAEFIEALARLHLLLDLFSEGIGQAYLQQKEMIIQEQAEELHLRDLNLAREMLEGLLPDGKLEIPYTDVGSIWIPSREIGGDFFDVFALEDGDVMLVIGDVSGKGISAALLVSMVKYVLKANAPLHRSPATLLMVANRLLYQDMGTELFVTMFVARYSPKTGKLLYTSAGHDPCYLCGQHPASKTVLDSLGPVLGVFPEVNLQDRELQLAPDDVLFLYTDGLVNVRCDGKFPVKSNMFCQTVQEHASLPAQELAQQVVDITLEHCEPTDDITLLVVKRISEERVYE